MPPFPESPRCLSSFQGNLFSLHCFDIQAEDRLTPGWHVGQPCGKASWESLVGKPHGKASRESHRSLNSLDGKPDTAGKDREERARASPHSRRGMTPLGRLQKYPQDPCQHCRGILRFLPQLLTRSFFFLSFLLFSLHLFKHSSQNF